MRAISAKINTKSRDVDIKSRTELAKELGIEIPKDGYWGDVPSKLCGIVGGAKEEKRS
ncbi:small, acid-soluble spore protein, alpha/beta type [Clostridium bovifaecis]|uniref:Small, acid-soluble spore protein, alpha/beta type n=1 Tax=Clostridium bovifaecis TaxID=2184719 RepID=A0A6I6FAX8_9CLOT|nr:small, acid-soluble spore protein, alpha/beta type [Clostridium bovifaecis]